MKNAQSYQRINDRYQKVEVLSILDTQQRLGKRAGGNQEGRKSKTNWTLESPNEAHLMEVS
jgi:hypothetical protein